MKTAAIYARVSSDKQREENTIASQTAALIAFAAEQRLRRSRRNGSSKTKAIVVRAVRPGLERVRDLAAEGQIEAVLVYAPDRLSRRYAYQILLIEELARHGVETAFINAPQAATAEDQLLRAVPGHDRGIRAGTDPRTIPPRQAPSRPPRTGQRAQRRALRLSLCSQER